MASGDTLIIWTVSSGQPSLDTPTFDTRNQHLVLDYDDTNDESIRFSGVMPQHYAATTGVTVRFGYSMTAGTSGDIDWNAAFERIQDGVTDIDADGFAAANSADAVAVPGTSGVTDVVSITFTAGADMDSVVAGDQFRLFVERGASGEASGPTGDAELHWVEIQET